MILQNILERTRSGKKKNGRRVLDYCDVLIWMTATYYQPIEAKGVSSMFNQLATSLKFILTLERPQLFHTTVPLRLYVQQVQSSRASQPQCSSALVVVERIKILDILVSPLALTSLIGRLLVGRDRDGYTYLREKRTIDFCHSYNALEAPS